MIDRARSRRRTIRTRPDTRYHGALAGEASPDADGDGWATVALCWTMHLLGRSILFAALFACATDEPAAIDTGTSNPNDTDTGTAHTDSGDTGAETGADTDTGKDTAADTSIDSGDTAADTSTDTGQDTGSDSGTDTAVDVGECSASNGCVVYACYCGECTAADIQCVTQAWSNANPCALMCPVSECPELESTVCDCDETTGSCVKK